MRVVVVIQARLGSTRLPSKVMADIAGKPMIAHVAERALAAAVGEVVIATTPDPTNDPIAAWCASQGLGLSCARPDVNEDDVLGRFVAVAEMTRASAIVRLSADCPLTDPRAVYLVAGPALGRRFDYIAASHPDSGWPEGIGDAEGITGWALQQSDYFALRSEREHVTRHVRVNAAQFQCGIAHINSPDLTRVDAFPDDVSRWTPGHFSVDTAEDLARVRAICAHLRPGAYSLDATLAAAKQAGVMG